MSLANFSWVIPSKLAGSSLVGGSSASSKTLWNDLEFLAGQGIRMLVSLERPAGSVEKMCTSLSIAWHYFPIPDFGIPEDANAFAKMVASCVKAIKEDVPVCIHCKAGIGRTGMALACVAGTILNLDAPEAVALVRKVRPAIEGREQERFIRQFLDKQATLPSRNSSGNSLT